MQAGLPVHRAGRRASTDASMQVESHQPRGVFQTLSHVKMALTCFWRRSRGWVERRRLGGIVGLGGGVSQKDLPGLEVAGKSTPVVQLLSCV